MVLEWSEVAARKMPSHRSFAATTASRIDLPLFSAMERGLREELLLDATEQLIGFEFVFARSRASQEPDMKHDKVTTPGLDAGPAHFPGDRARSGC